LVRVTNIRTLLARRVKQLASQDDGVTVIEFALLAFPFFALLGAILETGLFLLGSQVFDSAVDDAARSIMIGQAESYSPDDFRDKICEHTFGLIDCPAIRLRTRPISSFSSATTTAPVDIDGNWILGQQFDSGNPNDVILVEAYYKGNTFFGFDYGFSKFGNSLVISSARVFMNEPYKG